ncbi:ATP-binding cassette domain-containing protein [Halorubrum sp. DTA46]|uniref:ATP-binding cassette domain-containing protein n=1 Tax=Halorubrum sp. DTA46 TaxID=3402162 RepID=UPI003AAAF9B7
MIAVRDLSVSYGDLDVVSGVDLTVERGSFVGLVGPNGAGKSTVLRAIKGTVEPDAGSVELRGDRVSTLSAREAGRRVASVPQDTGLSFEFRVRHVVEMGRTPHLGRFDGHGPEDAAAVDEAMAAARVERFADRSIAAVSGGERQRVLLARALAQETPALLLDEPTASLDVNHAVATAGLVRGIVDEGRGALAAIHDLDMAARYCDEVVVLANGGVHAAGPPEAVLTGDTLRAAFDAEAFVGRNPATGSPSITAFDAVGGGESIDGDEDESAATTGTVHVVGTGRGAARVAARVAAAGHGISAGVVPAGDALAGVARDADGPMVTAPPFEAVAPERRDAARDLVRDADVAVVVGDGVGAAPPDLVAAAERTVTVDADIRDRKLLDAVRDAIVDEPSTGSADEPVDG